MYVCVFMQTLPQLAESLKQVRNSRGVPEGRCHLLPLESQGTWELGRQAAQRHRGKCTELPDIRNSKQKERKKNSWNIYLYLVLYFY